MPETNEKRIELILQQLEQLPTLPAIAVRVLEVTGKEDSNADEVVKLVESDQSLSARILQLVHRSDMGVRSEVNSVERAVLLLGFDAVRSAVLSLTVLQAFGENPNLPSNQFSREGFWKHSVAVACCAELLAEHCKGIDPAGAFVSGLLHDMGKVALDAVLPKSFSRVVEAADLLRSNIADLERTVIGLDHMVVGKRLAERWQLPATIRDCIWLHGQSPSALPATVRNPKLVNLITLCDLLAREQHLGYSGNYTFTVPKQSLLDALGLRQEQIDKVLLDLVAQMEVRAKSLGLGEASSSELYLQALSQANKELGRVSGQLANKNRRLSVRAKFFDALSAFQSDLRPDSPPTVVLEAIAQTAISVLGVKVAGAFSLAPTHDYAETVLVNESGEVFDTSMIDTPSAKRGPISAKDLEKALTVASASLGAPRLSRPTPADGPVMSVSEDLEWLVSCISPRLPHNQRYWICLEADGLCIGGVVWGAPEGESNRLSTQLHELTAIASGWALALRTAQIRDEARILSEQLAEANRKLHDAQNELVRSKLMSSVGEMAAGAAHEMNNPLAVISGRSQLLASQLTDPKQKHAANTIFDNSHRVSEIITELMDYAKPVPPQPREIEVAELIERVLHEAKAQVDPADRAIELTILDVPNVRVDVEQVTTALVEIVDNALHATDPKSGQISIHAAFDPYSARVVATISDNGCGMDENTLKRAFDPFFSSRPAGRRRGMGLSKALRWVEASGGSIRLESRVGFGTRTIVLLPAVIPAAAQHDEQKRVAQ